MNKEYPTKQESNPHSGKAWIEEGKLIDARRDGAYKAWMDLFSRFTDEQRQTLANRLAHDWHISAVTIKNTEGHRNYTDVISTEKP